jgi:hypothetical protein
MWQVVHMAEQSAICDSLVRYQEREINRGLREQESAEQLLRIRTQELWVTQVEAANYKLALEKQETITTESVRIEKKSKSQWRGSAIGATIGGVAAGPFGAIGGALLGYIIGPIFKK